MALLGANPSWADEFDPPRGEGKTAAWRAAWLEPGDGWWCRLGVCWRDQRSCDNGGEHLPSCKARPRAWAYSYFLWHRSHTYGAWLSTVAESKRDCARMRKWTLRSTEVSSVSPCVAVGAKSTPVPTRPGPWLPPGEGWWCLRSSQDGQASTSCSRFKEDCADDATFISGVEAKGTLDVHLLAPCTSQTHGWAFVVPGEDTRYEVLATEAECRQASTGAACVQVP